MSETITIKINLSQVESMTKEFMDRYDEFLKSDFTKADEMENEIVRIQLEIDKIRFSGRHSSLFWALERPYSWFGGDDLRYVWENEYNRVIDLINMIDSSIDHKAEIDKSIFKWLEMVNSNKPSMDTHLEYLEKRLEYTKSRLVTLTTHNKREELIATNEKEVDTELDGFTKFMVGIFFAAIAILIFSMCYYSMSS